MGSMRTVTYKVLENFDEKKDYGITIQRRFIPVIKQFKKGDIFKPIDYIEKIMKDPPVKLRLNKPNVSQYVYGAISKCTKIGMLESTVSSSTQDFKDFSDLETVKHWMSCLRSPVHKHKEVSQFRDESGSQYNSRRKLYFFDIWLKNGHSIEVTYWKNSSVDKDGDVIAKRITEKVKIKDIEHLLELYKKSGQESNESFQKLFHSYLTDSMHTGKMASSIHVDKSSIESYFMHNYAKIGIQFDPKKRYRINTQAKGERTSFTLNDLYVLLTEGRPTLLQKAAFMCKFQRGLDNSTFCDGFNFEAWEQLVEYFGTEDYENWDESKCPVPIEIVRLKTQYNHVGFLDVDAIHLLKKWLKKREELVGKKIRKGDPIFINQKGFAVKYLFFTRALRKLSRSAKMDKKLKGYERSVRYEQNSHELRDLLNSTLEAYGAGGYLAEHVIGHKQKSSYTKTEQLYLEKMRKQFGKASEAINIFSQVSNFIKNGNDEKNKMTEKIKSLEKQTQDLIREKHESKKTNESDDKISQTHMKRMEIMMDTMQRQQMQREEQMQRKMDELNQELKKLKLKD